MSTSPTAARGSASGSRIGSLDGLRGIAAAVVVVHHCLLSVPSLSSAAVDDKARAGVGSLAWALAYTPLHIVWAGREAVYVFFVLSGLVLTRQAMRAQFSWRGYFAQRLTRIYLPVWAAVALGVALVLLVPRRGLDGFGEWLQGLTRTVTPRTAAADALLLTGPTNIVSPLWSLRWEVVFSLALPVYVWVSRLARRTWAVAAVVLALLGAIAAGEPLASGVLIYLPMFALGTLMAYHLDAVTRWAEVRAAMTWWAITALGALLLISPWLTAPYLGHPPTPLAAVLAGPVPAVGAGLLVLAAAAGVTIKAALQATWIRALGMLSFSLYLVHEPVVVATALLLGRGHGAWTLPIAAPTALLVSWLFYRLVERPSHRLSRRLAARFRPARRAEPVSSPADAPADPAVGGRVARIAPRRRQEGRVRGHIRDAVHPPDLEGA